MKYNGEYIFTSARLGFRNWQASDIAAMAAINADEKVMEFFPSTTNLAQTVAFVEKMQKHFQEKGFCYFAVDTLEHHSYVGFIGMCEQTFVAHFTPCIDIGWRIKRSEWNKGYATEGAKRCILYARNDLQITTLYAIAPKVNTKSEHIMTKIGMVQQGEFEHPLLLKNERLRTCVLYKTIV